MSDLPTWARVLLYTAGAIATAIVLYAVVYLAVRSALRAHVTAQREAARRQEDLLRTIATSAEYVADVADAWAEGEAERRAAVSGAPADRAPSLPDSDVLPDAVDPTDPLTAGAPVGSSTPPDHDHSGSSDGGD